MKREILTRMASIPSTAGDVPVLVVAPNELGRRPVILVIHEIWGIKGHVDKVCMNLAQSGYIAVAPYFYSRYGDVDSLTDFREVHDLSRKVPDSEVMADLDEAVHWIGDLDGADPARIGVMGFCWGGRQVWLAAKHSSKINAGVAWYGGPIDAQATPLRPLNPLQVVDALKFPVLGLYGGSDAIISRESIEKMQTALKSFASLSRIHVFPNAPHGFHAQNRENYCAAESAEGDKLMYDWFSTYLPTRS